MPTATRTSCLMPWSIASRRSFGACAAHSAFIACVIVLGSRCETLLLRWLHEWEFGAGTHLMSARTQTNRLDCHFPSLLLDRELRVFHARQVCPLTCNRRRFPASSMTCFNLLPLRAQECGEFVGAANEAARDEYLRDCASARGGPDALHRQFFTQVDSLEVNASLLQESLGPMAIRASMARQQQGRAGYSSMWLKIREHGLGIRYLEGIISRVGLNEHLLDSSVVDEHRIAPGAGSQQRFPVVHLHSHRSRKLRVGIGQEVYALRPFGLLPRLHDEWIVHGEADDIRDACGFEIAQQRDIPRDVRRAARRCESARQSEQDHAPAPEELAHTDGAHLAVPHLRQLYGRNLLSFARRFHGKPVIVFEWTARIDSRLP